MKVLSGPDDDGYVGVMASAKELSDFLGEPIEKFGEINTMRIPCELLDLCDEVGSDD